MDLFYASSEKSHNLNDLHIIGVTCIFIASKYNEIYPLRLKTIVEKIGHYKIT